MYCIYVHIHIPTNSFDLSNSTDIRWKHATYYIAKTYNVLQKFYIKLCYLKLKFTFDTKGVLENNLLIKEENRKNRIT